MFSTELSNNYFSSYYYSVICSSCTLKKLVDSLVLYVVLMSSYGSTNQAELTLSVCCTSEALGKPDIYVSMFLLTYLVLELSLLFFWIRSSFVAFFLINRGPLKGTISNFPWKCINNFFTSLLPSPHSIHFLSGMELRSYWIFGRF